MTKAIRRLSARLLMGGLLLTTQACQGMMNSDPLPTTDAGCTIWREFHVKPSRADTPETIDGLIRLNRGMGAACTS